VGEFGFQRGDGPLLFLVRSPQVLKQDFETRDAIFKLEAFEVGGWIVLRRRGAF
jgi:hypothetical protein